MLKKKLERLDTVMDFFDSLDDKILNTIECIEDNIESNNKERLTKKL